MCANTTSVTVLCVASLHIASILCMTCAVPVVATGVDVFCIAPGAIDTPMFQASSLNHLSQVQRAEFIGKLGQARLIPPREIAEQIVFLCR